MIHFIIPKYTDYMGIELEGLTCKIMYLAQGIVILGIVILGIPI